ncbi:hypothetical protein SK128_013661, partial [Halocaridina rubra]
MMCMGNEKADLTPHKRLNSRMGIVLCNHMDFGEIPFTSMSPTLESLLKEKGYDVQE